MNKIALAWLGVVAAVLSGCGVGGEDGEHGRKSGRAKSITIRDLDARRLTIDTGGYHGDICIGTLGCYVDNQPRPPFDLPDGTHDILSNYSVDHDPAKGISLGTITVAGGIATVETSHFDPVDRTTIRARTVPIVVDPNGHRLSFGFDGSGKPLVNNTPRLLVGRRYGMADTESLHMEDGRHGFQARLIIDPDGVVSLEPALEEFFSWDGTTLRARTDEVSVDYRGYPGHLIIGKHDARGPVARYRLLRNRRYYMRDLQSRDGVTGAAHVGPGWDIYLDRNGRLVVDGGTQRYFRVSAEQRRMEATPITMEISATTDFCLAFRPDVCGKRDGAPLFVPVLKGRDYQLRGTSTWIKVDAAGSCSPGTLDIEGGGRVSVRCRDQAPPASCEGRAAGASCEDGNPCTGGDVCDDRGQCTGATRTCQDVRPTGTCIIKGTGAGFTAVFGYVNQAPDNVEIAAGPQNRVLGAVEDRGQPRWFRPGVHQVGFSVVSAGEPVAWQLGGQTATLGPDESKVCSDAPSSTGPRLVQTAEGLALQGPNDTRELVAPDPVTIAAGKILPTTGGLEPIGGSPEVTPDGAASYRIPIWLPPGRAGLEPGLALAYNSRGGNGLLGVGWSLAGLSQVTRCPKNLRNSNTVSAVGFDKTDLYCLDGNPLSLIDGTAGETAEYRTRQATFARIISEGDAQSTPATSQLGPAVFIVYQKNGRIHRYERAHDLGITAHVGGAPVNYAWLLTRIEDRARKRNNITFEYARSDHSGTSNDTLDIRVERIRYTGEEGLPGNRLVVFEYSANDRPDPIERYVSGVRLLQTRRLKAIRVSAPNPSTTEVLRSYQLGYADEAGIRSITGRSLLREVKECDGRNVCRPPTTFSWELGSTDFAAAADIDAVVPKLGFTVADVDQDGWDDIIYQQRRTEQMGSTSRLLEGLFWTRADQKGNFLPSSLVREYAPEGHFPISPLLMDVNGDGSPEVGVWHASFNRYRIPQEIRTYTFRAVSDGAEVAAASEMETATLFWGKRIFSVDLTGDGLSEIVSRTQAGDWKFRRGGVTGTPAWETLVTVEEEKAHYGTDWRDSFDFPLGVVPRDIDGDGVSEIVFRSWRFEGGTSATTTRVSAVRAPELRRGRPVFEDLAEAGDFDVNGDGLLDRFEPCDTHGPARCVSINTGRGLVRSAFWSGRVSGGATSVIGQGEAHAFADFDGDGLQDKIFLPQGESMQVARAGIQLVTPMAAGAPIRGGRYFSEEEGGGGYRGARLIDIDGDGLQDFLQLEPLDPAKPDSELVLRWYRRLGRKPDVVTKIENGLAGNQSQFDYADMVNPDSQATAAQGDPVCRPESGVPLRCVHRGVHVVISTTVDTGLASPSTRTNRFRYRAAVRDTYPGGKGVVFLKTTRERLDGALETNLFFGGSSADPYSAEAGFLLAGKVRQSEVTHGDLAVTSTYEYKVERFVHGTGGFAPVSYAVLPHIVTTRQRDGLAVVQREIKKTTTYHPDEYGNADTQEVAVSALATRIDPSGGASVQRTLLERSVVKSLYTNTPTRWLVGFAHDVTTTIDKLPGTGRIERKRTAVPDPDTGLVASEIVMPGGGDDFELATTYVRTAYGLVERVTTRGHSGSERQDRVVVTHYDAVNHAFPRLVINAAGHQSETVTHPGYGLPLWMRSPNGAVTTTSYDTFGRVRETNLADGSGSRTSYGAGQGPLAALSVTRQTLHGPTTVSQLDRLGREIRTSTSNARGRWTSIKREYDQRGRLDQVHSPIEETAPGSDDRTAASRQRQDGVTDYDYDERNRVIKVANPDGTVSTTRHFPRRKVSTDPAQKVTYELYDLSDRLIETGAGDGTAPATPQGTRPGQRLSFSYDFEGRIETTRDQRGNVTRVEYDQLGRRTGFADPNAAKRVTRYNAFGEIRREEIEGETPAAMYGRDRLGRATTLTDKDGTTTWRWDTARNGVGALGRTISAFGVVTTHSYDGLGRPGADSTFIEGQWFKVGRSYHPTTGRLASLAYPGVSALRGPPISTEVSYHYEPNGALDKITGAGDVTYFDVLERDELDRPTKEVAGDRSVTTRSHDWLKGTVSQIGLYSHDGGQALDVVGYEYDDRLNVRTRIDRTGALREETLIYDDKSQLTAWYDGREQASAAWAVAYSADEIGNNGGRTTFVRSQGTLTNTQTLLWTYPQGAAPRPHAPTHAEGMPPFTGQFGYDDRRGTQTMRPGQSITYSARDLPVTVTLPTTSVTFKYDAAGQRALKAERLGTLDEVSTAYVGGLYERRRQGNTVTHVFYVMAGSKVVAQITRTGADPAGATVDYLHHDRMGSVTAVTTADSPTSAKLAGRTWYDPFGGQYTPGAVPTLSAAITEVAPGVRLGFTGHEMDPDLGLINMRGRIYDPKLTRFLSPDPHTTNPASDLSYNRYAYVSNNPLKYIDPTGYDQSLVEFNCSTYGECQDDFELPPTEPESSWEGVNQWVQQAANRLEADAASANGNDAKGQAIVAPAGITAADLLSMGIGMLPFAGTGQSIVELISGKDYITGKDANRWLAAAGVVAGIIPGGKALLKGGAAGFELAVRGGAGDVVFHYTSQKAAAAIVRTGLFSQSSATNVGSYTAREAVELLGVKKAPEVVVEIRNGGQFIPNSPSIVQAHPLGPGGGLDLTNPARVPPACIVCVRPVSGP